MPIEKAKSERIIGVVTTGSASLTLASILLLSDIYQIENLPAVSGLPLLFIVVCGVLAILYVHYFLD